MKWIGIFIVILLVGMASLPFLATDKQRLVPEIKSVTADDAKIAQNVTKQFHRSIASKQAVQEFSLSNDELTAALNVASYSVPNIDIESRLTSLGLTLVATVKLEKRGFKRYVNVICMLTNGYEGADIDSCKIGSVTLPGDSLKPIIKYGLNKFVGKHSYDLWQHFITNLSFERNKLVVKNLDANMIKPALQASFNEAQNLVSGTSNLDKALVTNYIEHLSLQNYDSKSLMEPIRSAFSHVKEQTRNSPTDVRNRHVQAAIWALVIRYGNPKFGRLVGIPGKIGRGMSATLRNREDLALHFLYSAFLQLNSGTQTAFSIGEIKELIDSNAGGTGFSFADIVADKAGLTFAEFLTDPMTDTKSACLKLANVYTEDMFILDINHRPEGISAEEFNDRYKSIQSQKYKDVIEEIGQAMKQLELYR
ncbi:hypothetical protein KO525_04065 [Psychrosphaera sp. B3R10]|nr:MULTISPECIES: hypothetical protein [unclassified Psychrosphaera]MBU2883093.1 hypothetical protein [Psychrosphaera sp. I2R16]MBU2988550.1 hypothetical protein [Psychrosphaera sp. B3R10]